MDASAYVCARGFVCEEFGCVEGLSNQLWALVVLRNYANVVLGSYESVLYPGHHSMHCPGDEDVTSVALVGECCQ